MVRGVAHEDHGQREGESNAHLENHDVNIWQHDLEDALRSKNKSPVIQKCFHGKEVLDLVLLSNDICDDLGDTCGSNCLGFSS